MTTSIARSTLASILTVTLSACGGGSGGGGGAVQSDSAKKGVFLDSAVQGLEYRSGSLIGLTTSNGSFEYNSGQTVSFYIGDVLLGSAQGSSILTPMDLVPSAVDANDPTVVNILRLLQTLDDDGDPSNGIEITEVMRDLAEGVSVDLEQSVADFASDADVQNFISELTAASIAGARALVDQNQALAHFLNTLAELENDGGSSSGSSFSFTLSGNDTGVTGTQFTLPDIQHIDLEFNGFRTLSLIASRYINNPTKFYNEGVSFAAGIGDFSFSNSISYTAGIQINVNGDSYQYTFEQECTKPCSSAPFVINETNRQVILNNLRMEPDDVANTSQTGPIFISGTLNWEPEDEG